MRRFALRVAGKDAELLGIDRSVEHEATLAAAELGLGPRVVGFVEPEGYLVTAFLDGETATVGSSLRDRGRGGPASAAARSPHDRRGASTAFA